MKNLFAYGTLMYEEVWNRVSASEVAGVRAMLDGYVRKRIRGDVYPVIIPGEGRVRGILYQDVSNQELARLDSFEGGYYLRVEVEVTREDSVAVKAFTYVLRPQHHGLIGGGWSQTEFELNGLHQFLKRYDGFERL